MRLHATAQPIDCTFIGGGALMSATPHVTPAATMLRSRTDVEQEIARQLEAERARLQRQAGLARERVSQFHRPVERPFKAEERDQVTILFGGLTWKHEWLIKSVFQSAGYKVEILPTPDVASFQLGKEYGNNGQCNPTYFTVGHLVKYLQSLEAKGSRGRRSSTTTSSSPPARAGRAASGCTRPSTGSASRTPGSRDSASCSSSRTTASGRRDG
jgi:hypothetical protein